MAILEFLASPFLIVLAGGILTQASDSIAEATGLGERAGYPLALREVMDFRALEMTGVLLGGLTLLIFSGYALLCFNEPRKTGRPHLAGRLAGYFSILSGAIILATWSFLMGRGWSSFVAQARTLWFHALTEALSGVVLLVAGIALLQSRSRGPALLILANGFLMLSTLLALLTFGNRGHPMIMNGIAVLMTITSAYLVAFVYGWGHFVLRLEAQSKQSRASADKDRAA